MTNTATCKANKMPTNKKFGWFFSIVFLFLASHAFYKNDFLIFSVTGAISILFFLLALFASQYLMPLNRLWYELGIYMGKIINPIVLAAIFFILITPIALITRFFGRDSLLIKRKAASSYWIKRNPEEPSPESFKNQF